MASADHRLGLYSESLLDKVVLYIATGLFLCTIIFVTIQIIVRNVINDFTPYALTVTWTEPAARMALVIAAFWGAAVASRNKEHIVISFPLQKLQEKSNRLYLACRVFIGIVSIIYVLVIFYGMFQKVVGQWHTTFSGLDVIPGGIIFLSITIPLLLMVVYESWNVTEEFEIIERVREMRGQK